ncbi:hypothetical protein DW923_05185 [Butyricicoccus sp. AM42-5AC]|nr:hypothetical protein DW923_05185 [Butyricicoccus sp. AM42-5AC]
MIHEVGLMAAEVEAGQVRVFLPLGSADRITVLNFVAVNRYDNPAGVTASVRDADGLDALSEEADAKVACHDDAVLRDEEILGRFGTFAEMRRPCLIIAPARAERYNLRESRCRKFAGFEIFHFGVLLLQEKI